MVARLSVMITESINRPDASPPLLSTRTVTRLGCPARAVLLVIIATIVCARPAPSSSACTINAGRRFAVRKLESGNKTRTISPRRQVIVDSHFGPIPIFGERGQSPAQIGSLTFVDASFAKVDLLGRVNPRYDHARTLSFRERLHQLHLPVAVDPFD